MNEDSDALMQWGIEYTKLYSQFKRSSSPDAGQPGYLISQEWIEKFEHYIQFEKLKMDLKPDFSQTHIEQTFPGKITNSVFIEDEPTRYL